MRIGAFARGLAAAALLLQAAAAMAHEFWMLPDRFDPEANGSVVVRLEVGQYFSGGRVAITRSFITSLKLFSAAGVQDLTARVPSAQVGELGLAVGQPGSHVVAIDTEPSSITLPAEKFEDYLRLEGLDEISRSRLAEGRSALPGRERFRRNVKALVNAGGKSDATYAARTGQRFELVPLSDPSLLNPGQRLSVRVFFDGHPLAGSLVKFWRRPGAPEAVNARTDSQGIATVQLDRSGPWMVSAVHMIPAEASSEFDWDSYWANFTFQAGGGPG